MNDDKLQALILEALIGFYQFRIRLLRTLSFNDLLRQANPYLLRATLGHSGPKIVEHILSAYLSQSDKRAFGESFLQIAKVVSRGFISSNEFVYHNLYSQVFWQDITGEADFYLKIIRLMDDKTVAQSRYQFDEVWATTNNRCVGEFLYEFCNEDGTINWQKVVKFRNATEQPNGRKPKVA
jgi:hypothetical protein